jgi:hypothetical protein
MVQRPTSMMSMSRPRAGALASVAALALAALAAAPAFAAASPPAPAAFVLSPATAGPVLLHGVAGHVLRDMVNVRNLSGDAITLILQPADIKNASNGNADYVTAGLSEAGRWLQLSANRVRLAAHATRQVAFTLSIPKATTGASHYAGIVAINAADLAGAAAHSKAKQRGFTFYRISRQALPLTIRVPGPLTRSLALRSATLTVQPVGAGLVLGLLPGGSELIAGAKIKLRVVRDGRTIFTYASTLGQLFPGSGLNYRIPWPGRPTQGSYHVLGTISPQGAAAVSVNKTVEFTAATATLLRRVTPSAAAAPRPTPTSSMPGWVWVALAIAASLLIALSIIVYKLARRPAKSLASPR